MQLTYFEFAKEELETLNNGTATTGSSFTTSSSDDLDSGRHLERQTPHEEADPEPEHAYGQQQTAPGLETVLPFLRSCPGLPTLAPCDAAVCLAETVPNTCAVWGTIRCVHSLPLPGKADSQPSFTCLCNCQGR